MHERQSDHVSPAAPDSAPATGMDWTTMSLDVPEFDTNTLEGPPIEAATAPTGTPTTEPVPADGLADLPATSAVSLARRVRRTAGAADRRQRAHTAARQPRHGAARTGSEADRRHTAHCRPAPQRGTGPEGPDRLADPALTPGGEPAVTSSEPGALQAALAAFDSGRSALHAEPAGDLPTRPRGSEPIGRVRRAAGRHAEPCRSERPPRSTPGIPVRVHERQR